MTRKQTIQKVSRLLAAVLDMLNAEHERLTLHKRLVNDDSPEGTVAYCLRGLVNGAKLLADELPKDNGLMYQGRDTPTVESGTYLHRPRHKL